MQLETLLLCVCVSVEVCECVCACVLCACLCRGVSVHCVHQDDPKITSFVCLRVTGSAQWGTAAGVSECVCVGVCVRVCDQYACVRLYEYRSGR